MNLAFFGCCALATKDRVGQISHLPDKIYRRQFGPWDIELTSDPVQAKIKFNGWPAGVIDPLGGIIAAGQAANEDSFIAAIESELGQPIEQFMAIPPAGTGE